VKDRNRSWLVILVLAGHFVLGALYSVVVPIWEAHDETGHYPYVRYVATHWALPPVGGQISRWFDEAHQPPLYYQLAALLTFWVDTSDNLEPVLNPHGFSGTGRGGFNVVVHSPEIEGFPYRGTVLAIHLTRLFSVLISTLAVWVTYMLARAIFPQRPSLALGAMIFHGFLPTYLFIGSVVNNDVLASLLAGETILLFILLILRGPSLGTAVAMGCTLGLALLTKNSAMALIPMILGGTLLARWLKRWNWRETVWVGVVSFGVAAMISAGWYWRNLRLYGKIIPDRAKANPITTSFAPFVTSVQKTLSPGWAWSLFRNSFKSFWGVFGWGNLVMAEWIYPLLFLLSLIATGGVVRWIWRTLRRRRSLADERLLSVVILLWSIACVAAMPLYRAIYFIDPYLLPGRYLFPAISAISVLFCLGLSEWCPSRVEAEEGAREDRHVWPKRLGGQAYAVVLMGLVALACVVPFRYIAPVYARPATLSREEIRPQYPLDIEYGHTMALLGYDLPSNKVSPGEDITVVLYWCCLAPMDYNYTVAVHVVGPDYEPWGKLDTYPGNGNYPTTEWKVGECIRDVYRVRIREEMPGPMLGHLRVAVHKYPIKEDLPAFDSTGKEITPIFGRLKLTGAAKSSIVSPPMPSHPIRVNLGGEIELRGWDAPSVVRRGDAVEIVLYWEALADVPSDYTVFLQFLGEDGRPVAQRDAKPQDGFYPTDLWEKGEWIVDRHRLVVPANTPQGEYDLVVGMYRLETMTRLPAVASEGVRLQDDMVPLTTIRIE